MSRRARTSRPAGAAALFGRRASREIAARRTRRGRESAAERLVTRALAEAEATLTREPTAALAWAGTARSLAVRFLADGSSELGRRVRRTEAKALHAAGRFEEALTLLEGLIAELPRRGAALERASIEAVRGTLLGRLGNVEAARQAARSARRAYLRAGEVVAAAQVDVNEANVLHQQERHREALARYRRARAVLARADRAPQLAACDLGLANVLSVLGREAEARAAYARAEAAFAELGAEHLRCVAAYNRHYLDYLAGTPQAALDGLRAVRQAFTELGDARAVAHCDLDLAEIFAELGLVPEAEERAALGLAACDRLGLEAEAARCRVQLARARGRAGADTPSVAPLLAAAAETFERQDNEVGAATAAAVEADVLERAGRAEEAVRLARRAARALRRHGVAAREAGALTTEARALAALGGRSRAGARRQARRALERGGGRGWAAAEAHRLLARLAFEGGDLGGARRHAGRAMDTVERLAAGLHGDSERLRFVGDRHGVFRDAVRYWLAGARPSVRRAFDAAERSRVFALAEGRPPAAEELRAALRSFPVDETPRRTQRGLRRGVPARSREAPARRRRQHLFDVLPLARVQQRLGAGELLLEFLERPRVEDDAGRSEGALIAVTRARAAVVPLPHAARGLAGRLAAAADRLAVLGTVAPDAAPAARAALQELLAQASRALLAPAEAILRSARRVLVVPHGELWGVPFGALPMPFQADVPLGVARELVVLPAASWVARRPSSRPKHDPLVAVARADGAAPRVEAEARAVAAAARRGRALVGRSATAERLGEALASCRAVHLAGHGVFRWDRPGASALRLADRWITVDELERWSLPVELTVLSTCQGGAARSFGGGQFAGLVRAFLRAGSRAVVASPWSVDDAAAVAFFRHFHGKLATGASAPAALRAALVRAWRSGPVGGLSSFAILGAPWCGRAPAPGPVDGWRAGS